MSKQFELFRLQVGRRKVIKQTSFTKANKDLFEWNKFIDWFKMEKKTRPSFYNSAKIKWIFNFARALHLGDTFVSAADLNKQESRMCIAKV